MRILQLGKYYFPYMGGMETHLKDLCRSLSSRWNLEVLVFNSKRRFSREVVAGINVTRVPSLGRLASTEISPGLVAELSKRDYDILHIHTPNPMAMAAYLLARKPKAHRLVVTHHSDTVRQVRLRRAFEPIFKQVMSRADVVVTTSRRYLETSRELERYRDKTVVVPYGIDTSQFEKPDQREVEIIRAKYGPRLVVAVGRLIYYKGFDILIEAMSRVDAQVLVVGSGPLLAKLKEQSRALSLGSRVHFVGDVHNERIAPYYGAADVFALPSTARSEAFGIVQIEAMASGLPVVNTNIDSGVPEVSVNGLTGITVAPKDPYSLAEALRRLLLDKDLRDGFGRAGRLRARKEFSVGIMSDRICGIYQRLATT